MCLILFALSSIIMRDFDIKGHRAMKYLSIRQTAERWGISTRRIQVLCANGRVPGAIRIDYSWAIPDDEPKPKDARVKSGKYVKAGEAK